MGIDDLQDILGKKIPNALKAVQELEQAVTPQLAKIQQNRKDVDPELLKQLNESMKDIENAKAKLKQQNGNFNS